MRSGWLFVFLVVVGLPSCGDDEPSASGSTTTTTAAVVTTTAPAVATTTSPESGGPTTTPASDDVGDWDGARFDFGAIASVRRVGGRVDIQYNRQQLYRDDGTLQSGPQFTDEPVIYGNTDVPYVDDSPKLRRFVLADDAKVLRIADPIPCVSDEVMADPVWDPVSIDDLVDGAWQDRLMDSLVFDADGFVTQVRLSGACGSGSRPLTMTDVTLPSGSPIRQDSPRT